MKQLLSLAAGLVLVPTLIAMNGDRSIVDPVAASIAHPDRLASEIRALLPSSNM